MEFQRYAQSPLGNICLVKRVSRYAKILTLKANQLLRRASLNETEDQSELQTELFEMGRDYVRKFSELSTQEEMKKLEKEVDEY